MKNLFRHLFSNQVTIYPLVTFRVVFGLLMFISTARFWANGWIEEQYIIPDFFFSYYGFSWLPIIENAYFYILFFIVAISALAIALGSFYRIATILFFLSFTYLELVDVTNYLNHYYFVSLVAFILIWLPANRFFSIDSLLFPHIKSVHVPAWTINIIKFQLGVVYFFAGWAKLNVDWLMHALPLKMWLPSKTNLLLIGQFLDYEWIAYLFSWGGAVFDLSIFFLLIHPKTRLLAYCMVLFFHIITWLLFPIGMFPFIMIGSTLIFFSASFHKKIIDFFSRKSTSDRKATYSSMSMSKLSKITTAAIFIYIVFQLTFPFRYLLYPGNLFWTEQGYRFSWRVMLMEKAGYATFYVTDSATGKTATIDNAMYLTPNQEKMMATQPDLMLQYAHFLRKEYEKIGFEEPVVQTESFVSLNGSGSRLYIDPSVDLANIEDSFAHKDWILSYSK